MICDKEIQGYVVDDVPPAVLTRRQGNCAEGEGPSSPDAPRPYVQALCAPCNCNQCPHSSLMAISLRAAGEPSISEGGNCLNFAAGPQ
jgi:hypothetical protein